MSETLTAVHYGASILVSQELLDDCAVDIWAGIREWEAMTPEQRAERIAERTEAERLQRVERKARWKRLRKSTKGTLRAVVGVHRPTKNGWCRSCADSESPDYWPCETFELIERKAQP